VIIRLDHRRMNRSRVHPTLSNLTGAPFCDAAGGIVSSSEGNQPDPPSPIPVGVGIGGQMDHLYRLIVSLHEQVASLRTTAHQHTASGAEDLSGTGGHQSDSPPPIPVGVSVGAKMDHLHRLIVSLHEQVASLRTTAHQHTASEAEDPM
jgi:hypothetical protein